MLTIKKELDGRSCFSLDGLDDTRALGEKIAAVLRPGMTLLMRGELGAGKTTLVRELCRALEADLQPVFRVGQRVRAGADPGRACRPVPS